VHHRHAGDGAGSSPALTTKFRINYPEIMEGSKLPIGYGVWCTPPPNTVRVRGVWVDGGGRLRFNSLLISKN
jgi:hypothetical protein